VAGLDLRRLKTVVHSIKKLRDISYIFWLAHQPERTCVVKGGRQAIAEGELVPLLQVCGG